MDLQASPQKRIALIDGNNFFCSCERAVQPALEKRPLVVLSNNDGCVISRTQEAKALGIRMAAPWFEIRHLAKSHGLQALSSNFPLYGDISSRMMSIIGQFAPGQEIYSIDESFLDLTGMPEAGEDLGRRLRARVLQWIGIPTCVGIASTKTLAKLANHLAKKYPALQGVCDLSALPEARFEKALSAVPVDDIWGVGRKLAPKLKNLGIHTALDMARQDQEWLRDTFSIVVAKTALELRGQACIDMALPEPRQQIMISRSFGEPVSDMDNLTQAISTFVTRAAEKLRKQQSLAGVLQVFIYTNRFSSGPQHVGNILLQLPLPTDSLLTLTRHAMDGLRRIYKEGMRYTKAGVCLHDLSAVNATHRQENLFDDIPAIEHSPLSATLDAISQRFGQTSVMLASSMPTRNTRWHARQQHASAACTTNWQQIIQVTR